MQLLTAISELNAYRALLADLQQSSGQTGSPAGFGRPRSVRLPLLARLHQDGTRQA